MKGKILYLDLEISSSGKIGEIGLVTGERALRTVSIEEAKSFIWEDREKIEYLAGHNLVDFDLGYLQKSSLWPLLEEVPLIDTLPISLLLFNEKSFHRLPKRYKNEDDFRNDPLKDAQLTRQLHLQAIERFFSLEHDLQNLFYTLLRKEEKFSGFFRALSTGLESLDRFTLLSLIQEGYGELLQDFTLLEKTIESRPIELAYILALLTPVIEAKSPPPKILYDYPGLPALQKRLTLPDSVDSSILTEFSESVFGFGGFREFQRLEATLDTGTTLSQREIVEAALYEESFLAVLPTGGGKTFTFWLPALYRAKHIKGLTVVISPLQALMRDHIESFHRQVANYSAVAISGYQTSPERADAIEQVVNGRADILYIAPESLRSETIFKILKNRLIDRFVVDEAHCLSTWGHDFRHDYFYIADFIKDLLAEQPWQERIPVSCFTATAKPDVVEDITRYFEEQLGLEMGRYLARPERTNLLYDSISAEKADEKYLRLLEILNSRQGPALIYIPTSTHQCDEIAEKLTRDLTPRQVKAFHSHLDPEIKREILRGYLENEIDIVVATTAFGMGVDKPDIQTVIHYEISNSLENYAQEAGRGARDKSLEAYCPILYSERDLDKHFSTLNRTRLSANEVNAIFQVLRKLPTDHVLLSSREIAQLAGWDTEGEDESWDVKVKTALLELEREGYLERNRNKVRFFADAVTRNAFEKLEKIKAEKDLDELEYRTLSRILHSLMGRGKPAASQIDEIAIILDLSREDIAEGIWKLKEYDIVEDAQEMRLTLFKTSTSRFEKVQVIEKILLEYFISLSEGALTLRSLNEMLIERGALDESDNETDTIRKLLQNWRRKGTFRFHRIDRQNDVWSYKLLDIPKLRKGVVIRLDLAERLMVQIHKNAVFEKGKAVVDFSMLDLKKALERPVKWIDKTLLFLHENRVLELGQGRFIYYAPMQIEKTGKFAYKRRYTKLEYAKRLKAYYTRKGEAIHIIGEYAARMGRNPGDAVRFLGDYFTMPYLNFKRRYKLLKEELARPMTKRRYERIFGSLSETQREIIEDNEHDAIMVLAGPGSGKTKVLVHKIASLILKEDVKPDQFMMLTFSHAAVMEFRRRLYDLIGEMARDVEIRTFHGFALQTVGRRITEENSDLLHNVVEEAAKQIESGAAHPPFKSVLMLDEFQDINAASYRLVRALYDYQEGNMRLIAVGDDDQCIMQSVNGADVAFFGHYEKDFAGEGGFWRYHLTVNYRSTPSIVAVAGRIIEPLHTRLKEMPITAWESGEDSPVIFHLCRSPHLVSAATDILGGSIAADGISTAILAYTNREVGALHALLDEAGIRAEYLVGRQGYQLKNIQELFVFTRELHSNTGESTRLTPMLLERVLERVVRRFGHSLSIPLLEHIVEGYVEQYEVSYLSLWDSWIEEIDFDEFEPSAKTLISTMHKSKGREFERTGVLIPKRSSSDDEWLRLLYVAVTRAKKHLVLISDDVALAERLESRSWFRRGPLRIIRQEKLYKPAPLEVRFMSLRDVFLGVSYYSALRPEEAPVAGDRCEMKKVAGLYYLFYNNRKVERLSKSFSHTLDTIFAEGWKLREAIVDNVVMWRDRERDLWFPHVLAKLVFEK